MITFLLGIGIVLIAFWAIYLVFQLIWLIISAIFSLFF